MLHGDDITAICNMADTGSLIATRRQEMERGLYLGHIVASNFERPSLSFSTVVTEVCCQSLWP